MAAIWKTPGPALSQVRSGGDEETRTPNPRLAKAVLCQLSYVPERAAHNHADPNNTDVSATG